MDSQAQFSDCLKESKYPVFIVDSNLAVIAVNQYIKDNQNAVKTSDLLCDILKDYPAEYEKIKENCNNGVYSVEPLRNEFHQSIAFVTSPVYENGERFTVCCMIPAAAGYGLGDDNASYLAEKYKTGLKNILDIIHPISTKLEEHDEYGTLEYLNRIAHSCYTMLKYSASVKDYSDASKGRLVLSTAPVCLNSILNDIAASAGMIISNKEYNLEFANCPDELFANIDVQKFAVVVFNIIANACAFSPQTSTIFIKLEKSGKNAVISVKDEGDGMSPVEIMSAFNPFFSNDRSRSNALGMGLSVAKKLVELHGGNIYIESNDSYGTTVKFSVPLDFDIDKKVAVKNAYHKYAKPFSLDNTTDLHMTFAELCDLTLF